MFATFSKNGIEVSNSFDGLNLDYYGGLVVYILVEGKGWIKTDVGNPTKVAGWWRGAGAVDLGAVFGGGHDMTCLFYRVNLGENDASTSIKSIAYAFVTVAGNAKGWLAFFYERLGFLLTGQMPLFYLHS